MNLAVGFGSCPGLSYFLAAAFQESNVGVSTVRVSVFSSSVEGRAAADEGYCVMRSVIIASP